MDAPFACSSSKWQGQNEQPHWNDSSTGEAAVSGAAAPAVGAEAAADVPVPLSSVSPHGASACCERVSVLASASAAVDACAAAELATGTVVAVAEAHTVPAVAPVVPSLLAPLTTPPSAAPPARMQGSVMVGLPMSLRTGLLPADTSAAPLPPHVEGPQAAVTACGTAALASAAMPGLLDASAAFARTNARSPRTK